VNVALLPVCVCVCVCVNNVQAADQKGSLSWLSAATHTYTTSDNYTVWVEAFTGVGSVFLTTTVPVYGKNITTTTTAAAAAAIWHNG